MILGDIVYSKYKLPYGLRSLEGKVKLVHISEVLSNESGLNADAFVLLDFKKILKN